MSERDDGPKSQEERADLFLREIWRSMRNNADAVAQLQAYAIVTALECVGVLSAEKAELWNLRLGTCPGHDDEGGRAWCAYCGELPKRADEDEGRDSPDEDE